MAVHYSFITRWKTEAPIGDVWLAIRNSFEWPVWWKDFVRVKEVKPGNSYGIGSVIRYTLKSPANYKLTFDLELMERIEYQVLAGKAYGELEGEGTWNFYEKDGAVFVECHWNVRTTKAWMNLFAFILKPAFEYNHKLVMKNGARCLSRHLGKDVIPLQ